MDQLRRTADVQMRNERRTSALVAGMNPVGLFEPRSGGWTQRATASEPPATRPTDPPGPPPPEREGDRVSGLVSPALVLLATTAILEGYSLLDVIPGGERRWSAVALVVLTVPLALALTRPRPGRPRSTMQKVLAVGSTLLVGLTVLTLLIDRSGLARLLGAYDLLFALVALAAVVVVERSRAT